MRGRFGRYRPPSAGVAVGALPRRTLEDPPNVATLAFDALVCARKLETCFQMIECQIDSVGGLGLPRGKSGAQKNKCAQETGSLEPQGSCPFSAESHIHCPFPSVIEPVDDGNGTGSFTPQSELSTPEADLLERFGPMAPLALPPKSAPVDVVLLVAFEASLGKADLSFDRSPVTRPARQSRVGAFKNEFGPGIVVESPQGPAVRIMALLALGTQAPPVRIVRLVAAHALARAVFVGGCQVTRLACGGGVKTDQWEAGQSVIEEHIGVPASLVVASLAFLPLLAAMRIVLRMAIEARPPPLFGLDRPFVAGRARDLSVFSPKRIFRDSGVVEECALPALGRMAGSAPGPIDSPVFIVVLVARAALCPQLGPVESPRMARIARGPAMRALEGERGLVMVEKGAFPILRGMALTAPAPVAAVVGVVLSVAGQTIGRRLLEASVRVAPAAGGVLVLALQ